MIQYYTALAVAASKENAPADDMDTFYTIKSNEYNFIAKMAEKLKLGQSTVIDFFQDPRAGDVQFVHDNIGRICEDIEQVMRKAIGKLEYDNSNEAGDRVSNSSSEIHRLTYENEVDATIQLAVELVGRIGEARDDMYINDAAAMYARLREQIKNFILKLNATLEAFEMDYATTTKVESTNAVIKDDWKILHELKVKVLEYKQRQVDTVREESKTTFDLINDIAIIVRVYYDVHDVSARLFVAINILEFDLKYST